MNIKQTLTEYVQKELTHHLKERENITAFSLRIGMQTQRIRGFLAGVTSLRLDTADRILKAIEAYQQ